ncbi:MAG: mdlB [Rickettsiales bacterium]|jgi:ATP-binding cassette subfamily B protein|nr:mdlB [Rickettsiales bacterium]
MKNHSLPTTLPAFFWHFIKKQPIAFALLFLVPSAIVLETNVLPYSLKLLIDGIEQYEGDKADIFTVIAPALWLGSLSWIGMIVIFRLQNHWQGWVVPRFQADIRMSVLDYLTQHSHHYFSNQLSGKLANKVNDLPSSLESIRSILCWNVVSTFAAITVSLVLMDTVNPVFSWILGIWAVTHLALTFSFSRIVYRASEANAEDRSRLSGIVVDTIANAISMRIFARKRYEISYIQKKQDIEKKSNKRLILSMNWLRLLMDIPVTAMLGAMVYFLVTGWQKDQITTGDMVFIFNTCWAVTFHMWMLGHALTDLFRDVGVAQQALSLIAVPHDIQDNEEALPLQVRKGEIRFDGVSFYYQRNTNIFHNTDVTITPGSHVGLVGFSGSGKTTFVHLILRFFDVHGGRILIDGQNIADVTQDSLHEAIAMIPQDTSLFHRTIMENIRYGRLDASDEEVIAASTRAHCHEFISQLPEGYNALVGERGIKLSGGQRQRIAIARAMLKNAPILILDEATSALDSVTEKHIQDGLHELMEGRTTIVIAHRLSTLSEMDRILVFNKGHIIEDGTHESLLKMNGHYAKMWHMQAGGFLPESEDV